MLYPMAAMALLAIIVGVITLKTRFKSVKTKTVHHSFYKLMTSDQDIPEDVIKTGRNFNNQFEIPVLFYVVCLLYITLHIDSTFAVATAWGFVATRYIHSYIHLTYNNVLHRLSIFWLGCVAIIALWVNLLILGS